MPEKKPQLGDKYAIISNGRRSDISGPFYVVSVRGSLVALSSDNQPNPQSSRNWRIGSEGELLNTTRWSMQRAEPWAEEHLEARRRQNLQYRVGSLFDAHRRDYYEKLTMAELLALFRILNKGEKKDGDAPESEGSGKGTG